MAAAAAYERRALLLPEELVGKTVVIEQADDAQMKLRVLGSQRSSYYVVGANGLYVSEALPAR